MNDIIDPRIDKPISLGDVDELSVQIAPIGNFTGSDKDGNPIPEKLSEEALYSLAEKLNSSGEEVLCDIDHASTRLGCEKDSKAAGWFSQFFVSPLKGLWAKIKLTTLGKKLVEDREYRFLSPVFSLNENGEPVDLHSVAFTNVPAFKNHIKPILNSESNEIFNKEIISMDMTKDELKELIISTISEMKVAEEKAEAVEEIKEEIKETEVVKEDVENTTCETTEEIKNEESIEKTEVVEETTEEKPVEEKVEEKEEVIKIEALNSSPSIIKDVEPIWKKLKGKEFLDWASKNKNYQI